VSAEIAKDDRFLVDGELVTVVAASPASAGFECIVKSATRGLLEVFMRSEDVGKYKMAASDGTGDSGRAIAAVWAEWMRWAIPRMRSAVLATRPIRPFPHQDDAVFGVMLSQPRLRFLLADEPGTGKTLMTGMYLAEGRRRGLILGKTVIVVPAHLVEKWIRELKRFFGIDAHRVTAEIGRDPLDLRDDVDVWVVSLDLYTYNSDVRRRVMPSSAASSIAPASSRMKCSGEDPAGARGRNRSTARYWYKVVILAVAARVVPKASWVRWAVVRTRCSCSMRSSHRSRAVRRAASSAASCGLRASRPPERGRPGRA
jgi:hypothetical protein